MKRKKPQPLEELQLARIRKRVYLVRLPSMEDSYSDNMMPLTRYAYFLTEHHSTVVPRESKHIWKKIMTS